MKPNVTNKASEDLLNTLHQMIEKDLIDRIQSGEASIQEISAAIRFLKDNEVVADIEYNKPIKQLADAVTVVAELPFDTEDEDDVD